MVRILNLFLSVKFTFITVGKVTQRTLVSFESCLRLDKLSVSLPFFLRRVPFSVEVVAFYFLPLLFKNAFLIDLRFFVSLKYINDNRIHGYL